MEDCRFLFSFPESPRLEQSLPKSIKCRLQLKFSSNLSSSFVLEGYSTETLCSILICWDFLLIRLDSAEMV